MKTAALFGAATELGAFLNEASPDVITSLKTFGMRLGSAYQIYDDCVDLAGDEEQVGKTLGSDLRKGKLTLPILYLLQQSSSDEWHRISQIILEGDDNDVARLVQQALDAGAVRNAVSTGRKFIREAADCLDIVPDNKYRHALKQLVETLDAMIAPFGQQS